MTQTKDAAARRLADLHFTVEPGMTHIYRLVAPPDTEAGPDEPFKLLEVNENSPTISRILPLGFDPIPAAASTTRRSSWNCRRKSSTESGPAS